MSFGKIWKKQVQVPKGNVSLFKPKQGFELEEDVKDEKCCEEARKKYMEKTKILYLWGDEKMPAKGSNWYRFGDSEKWSCEKLYSLLELQLKPLDETWTEYMVDCKKIKEEWDRCKNGN